MIPLAVLRSLVPSGSSGLPGNPSSYPYLEAFFYRCWALKGPYKGLKGPYKALKGPYKALKGPYKALKVPYKALKGLTRPSRAL